MNDVIRESRTSDGDMYRDWYITNKIFSFIDGILDLDSFREQIYNNGIYLSQEEAEKIKYNELNHVDYSLYIDSLSKHLRIISQEDLKKEWDKKLKNDRRESFLRLLFFILLTSCCLYWHYIDSFICVGLFFAILLFMFIYKFVTKPLMYEVRFVESNDEKFR